MNIFVKVYANLNLGDDLFLHILFKRYPNVVFYVDAPSYYKEILKQYPNILIFDKAHSHNVSLVRRIYRRLCFKISPKFLKRYLNYEMSNVYEEFISNSQAFIFIGGSIFMEPKNRTYSLSLIFYNYLINNHKKLKKFFLGCNFGPYYSREFLLEHKEVFKHFDDICFRDKYSFDLFSDLSNVRLHSDIVFSLKLPNVNHEEKSIGFTLRVCDKKDSMRFLRHHQQLINCFLSQGYSIKLFSFCKNEGDENFVNQVYDTLSFKSNFNKVEKVFYIGNIDSFLKKYLSVEYMICERFHSMIISLLAKQTILPVMYSNKMETVLNDIAFDGIRYTNSQFISEDIITISNSLLNNNYLLPENIKNDALKHFKVLDSFCNENTNE